METNVSKGRNIVFGAISIVIGVSLLGIVINLLAGNQSFLVVFVRFILTCLLCYCVYSGQSWARWVCIVLMGIACVVGLFGTLAIFISPLAGVLSFFYFAAYLAVILLLLIPQSVRDYFNSQKLTM